MARRSVEKHYSGQCERQACGYQFDLGDTIYIVQIGMERRDLCQNCINEILMLIDGMPNQMQLQ
jgi:hypothetical protein